MLGCLLKPGELPLLPTEFVETAEEKKMSRNALCSFKESSFKNPSCDVIEGKLPSTKMVPLEMVLRQDCMAVSAR